MDVFAGGILLILFGMAAQALPILFGFGAALVVASTLLAAAIVSISRALTARRIDGMQGLVGVVYLAVALTVLRHPSWGVAGLAVIVATALVVDGVIEIVFYFVASDRPGSTWLLMT